MTKPVKFGVALIPCILAAALIFDVFAKARLHDDFGTIMSLAGAIAGIASALIIWILCEAIRAKDRYIETLRWPKGFFCPKCGNVKGWRLRSPAWLWQCQDPDCGAQTSIRAGTVMHKSKLPLTVWFWSAYLMASASNGISALQLKKQLSLGSYQTAWLLCAKLRRNR